LTRQPSGTFSTAHASGDVTRTDGDRAELEEWRRKRKENEAAMLCSLNNKEDCVSCGS